MKDVVYIVNGRCKEVLHYNVNKGLAYVLRNKAKNSGNYSSGLVTVVPNGTYK